VKQKQRDVQVDILETHLRKILLSPLQPL